MGVHRSAPRTTSFLGGASRPDRRISEATHGSWFVSESAPAGPNPRQKVRRRSPNIQPLIMTQSTAAHLPLDTKGWSEHVGRRSIHDFDDSRALYGEPNGEPRSANTCERVRIRADDKPCTVAQFRKPPNPHEHQKPSPQVLGSNPRGARIFPGQRVEPRTPAAGSPLDPFSEPVRPTTNGGRADLRVHRLRTGGTGTWWCGLPTRSSREAPRGGGRRRLGRCRPAPRRNK
jgi:hypothetical protein